MYTSPTVAVGGKGKSPEQHCAIVQCTGREKFAHTRACTPPLTYLMTIAVTPSFPEVNFIGGVPASVVTVLGGAHRFFALSLMFPVQCSFHGCSLSACLQ